MPARFIRSIPHARRIPALSATQSGIDLFSPHLSAQSVDFYLQSLAAVCKSMLKCFSMKPDIHEQESRAYGALKEMFQGGRPLIFVCTPEEGRVRLLLKDLAEKLFTDPAPVWSWSLTAGLQPPDGRPPEMLSPQAVLDFIAAHGARGIFHLKDFHPFMSENAGIRRQLRDIYENCM